VPDVLSAIRASVDRLEQLVAPLGDDVTRHAYPTEWTIADVVSHLGSGAVIFQHLLAHSLDGVGVPDGFAQGVWAEWDAKSPRAKVDDGVVADAAYTARLEAVKPS
jgi:hypothetical protein